MSFLKFLIAVLLLTPTAAAQECPRVVLTCPAQVARQGTPLTLDASVSGGDPGARYTFNWTTSAGTIMSGQGTRAATLDTTGLAGVTIKVTVELGGLPETCPKSVSCEAGVNQPPPDPHPIDRYSGFSFEDEKARLDNFAIHLLGSPKLRGYLIVSAGGSVSPAEARRKARRALWYLTNTRGVPAARVRLLYSGRSLAETVLWALPSDIESPFAGEIIKPGGGKVRGRRRR